MMLNKVPIKEQAENNFSWTAELGTWIGVTSCYFIKGLKSLIALFHTSNENASGGSICTKMSQFLFLGKSDASRQNFIEQYRLSPKKQKDLRIKYLQVFAFFCIIPQRS